MSVKISPFLEKPFSFKNLYFDAETEGEGEGHGEEEDDDGGSGGLEVRVGT